MLSLFFSFRVSDLYDPQRGTFYQLQNKDMQLIPDKIWPFDYHGHKLTLCLFQTRPMQMGNWSKDMCIGWAVAREEFSLMRSLTSGQEVKMDYKVNEVVFLIRLNEDLPPLRAATGMTDAIVFLDGSIETKRSSVHAFWLRPPSLHWLTLTWVRDMYEPKDEGDGITLTIA